jgi:hypothetical protein
VYVGVAAEIKVVKKAKKHFVGNSGEVYYVFA